MTRALILITGTGRSGTSTVSGTLHHLGLHVPGPYLGANKSNPKGFYESRWAVDFHKAITGAAKIDDFDSRPSAFDRAQQVVTDEMRASLVEFLGEQSAEHDQVVVKDPRSVWVQRVWRDAAAEAGLDIRYISMLRHPAETIGSRSTYYAKKSDEERRRAYEIMSIARWVNSQLISERETRGERRAFVGYPELLEDWRGVMAGLRADLDLDLDGDLDPARHHPVDDFIDPGLRRLRVTWEELEIPDDLQDVAERVWEALVELRDAHGRCQPASAELDTLTERFGRLLAQAKAVAHDTIVEERAAAADDAARRVRERARRRNERRRPENRPVDEIGGRELLREARKRIAHRLMKRRP